MTPSWCKQERVISSVRSSAIVPRFAERPQEPERRAYLCASAIYHSSQRAEGTVLGVLSRNHIADGHLWRATSFADQQAARSLLERGVIISVPFTPDAYILTPFGLQVAGAYTLISFDSDP